MVGDVSDSHLDLRLQGTDDMEEADVVIGWVFHEEEFVFSMVEPT